MFYWSFTSLIHFWPPQFLILATPMGPSQFIVPTVRLRNDLLLCRVGR